MSHSLIENIRRKEEARHATIVGFLMTTDRETLSDRARCDAALERQVARVTTAEFAAAATVAAELKRRQSADAFRQAMANP